MSAEAPKKKKKKPKKRRYAEEDIGFEVKIELDLAAVDMTVEAATGKTVVLISGTAFHEGKNKNNWELGAEAGRSVAEQMRGADLTLNHPHADGAGFTRNMDGGVDEAVVGIVTSAVFIDEGDGWRVDFTAEVHRSELFEALETGLWLRPEYGVSIGGYGVPSDYDEETGYAMFASEFALDHLAIVHRPAYPDASIDSAVRVEVEELATPKAQTATLKYGSALRQANEVLNMDEETPIEANTEELEQAKADLILANATIEAFQQKEAEKAEADRQTVVDEATALGLSGHEDLSTEVITNLIASWKEAQPAEEEEIVELEAVKTPSTEEVIASTPAPEGEVYVANFINGTHLKTAEDIYARAFNSWVAAYNRGLGVADDRATRFEDLTHEQKELLNFTESD